MLVTLIFMMSFFRQWEVLFFSLWIPKKVYHTMSTRV